MSNPPSQRRAMPSPVMDGVVRGVVRGLLSGAVLAATVTVGATAAVSAGAAPQPPLARVSASRAAATACADLLVLSVDPHGSGWGGPESLAGSSRRITASVATRARAAGQSVAASHLGVPSPGVGELVGSAPLGTRTLEAETPHRVRAWLAPVSPAVNKVARALRADLAACPDQAYALVGAAQGADVVHRLLLRLPGSSLGPLLDSHVVGAALVSDGDRMPATRATLVGAPAAAGSGRGVVARYLEPRGDVPAAALPVQVTSVCTHGDLVCDPRGSSVRRALAAYHSTDTTGGSSAGAHALDSAAAQLALRATAWPAPAIGQRVTATTATAISTQLTPHIAQAYAAGLVFDHVAGLPAGVTLDAHGLLSGRVTSPGSSTVTYAVHGTTPATSSRTGSLVLAVSAPSTTPPTGPTTGPAVSAGGEDSCQVRGDGSAWCVGDNHWGQLGDGTGIDRTSPVRVGSGDPASANRTWASISTSGASTCGVQTDGSLWCWGLNYRGELGLGGGPNRFNPQRIGTAATWASVSAGWMHTCAVRTNGTLWCWGGDERGQLGLGAAGDNKQVPTRVGTDSDWTSVSVGGWHTCALRTDHSAWCWGRDDLGELGIGSVSQRTTPTRVAGTTTWASISANWSSTCAVSLAGAASCWGINDEGQLGDGTRTQRDQPVAVVGGHDFTTVTMGDSHACGIDTDHVAWCWGANRYGQLGTGSSQAYAVAPQRVTGGGSWSGIDAGWMHTCALRSSGGGLQCWGNGEDGQLGRGSRADQDTPPGVAAPAAAHAATRRTDAHLVVTTFNVLGSQHTAPGGGAPHYAPGRIRAEWATNLLQSYGSDIVGFQEMQPDQLADLKRSLGATYGFYSGGDKGGAKEVLQTVMWDRSQWTFKQARTVRIPFLGKLRPNPMVKLESVATGQDIWVLNLHNSAKMTAERQAERKKALKIEAAQVNAARENHVPVILLGDLNDHRTPYCFLTGHTDLQAAQGGTHTAGSCTPPKRLRVDWIFGSPEFTPIAFRLEQSGRVARTTDHSVLSATFTIPGA